MKRLAAAVVLVVGFAVPAVAQTDQRNDRLPPVEEPRLGRTHDFGGVKLDGNKGPGGITWTQGKVKTEFENLMTVRTSFNSELQKSVDSL